MTRTRLAALALAAAAVLPTTAPPAEAAPPPNCAAVRYFKPARQPRTCTAYRTVTLRPGQTVRVNLHGPTGHYRPLDRTLAATATGGRGRGGVVYAGTARERGVAARRRHVRTVLIARSNTGTGSVKATATLTYRQQDAP